ncbi:ferredoxin, 2Fe-2S [Epibacterium ulvae]|uniref:Ferredoxin, 2Fe-2S n=1 Tax=Epibacterium ulvae TaxID=1156985 RepID=A0A1G5QFC5_9RHOB|nr:hypothetical protein [Epibacterium ulvae]SCZ60372.1 ferredoxin, 2Fe-2S [Epibacterium ulvae]
MAQITDIEFDGTSHKFDMAVGSTGMKSARDNTIKGIDAGCKGICARSHVYIDKAWSDRLPSKSEIEEDMRDFTFKPDLMTSRLTRQWKITSELNGSIVYRPEPQL